MSNIDRIAPDAPVAAVSTTELTNQNVTVTAQFSEDSAVREYSLDDRTWRNYTGGVVMTASGTVYFRATDAAGNTSQTACTVSNIDKTAPVAPVAALSTTKPTNQNVTVTASFSKDSAVKEYSLDNRTWRSYTGGVVMTANGTVYFRATDAAGNTSRTACKVSNIDKVAPDAPSASASTTKTTYTAVTVAASFSKDSAVKEYSLDNRTWRSYTGAVVMSANGTVYFRATDAVGNVSRVTSYTVRNIDTSSVLPGREMTGDIEQKQSAFNVKLNTPGRYSLSGDFGTLSGTVTLRDGLRNIASGKIKNGTLVFNKGKGVLLDGSGQYSLLVTNKAKNIIATSYQFRLDADTLFSKADPSHGSWVTAKTLGTVAAPKTLVGDGWVGFSADTAYYAITLKTAASLNFTVNSNDAVKFTVSSLTPQNKLKSLQKFTVKPKNGAVTTASSKKSLLVAAGTYYISMVSTNAKKGGNASYSVGINNLSVFFPKGDNSNDTWQAASLKAPAALGDTLNGWVGFGDAADYYKFTVTKTGSVAVNLNQATAQAVEARQLKLSLLDASGKKVALTAYGSDSFASRKEIAAGTYYLGVICGNVRKYNTSYGVSVGMLAG